MIHIDKVGKRYGRQHVLKDINLAIAPGESVAMIGPNGSGKTTLIKSILRLVLPEEGSIAVNGVSIDDGCDYRKHIGYMPQMSRLPEHMRVSQLFEMMKQARKDKSADQLDEELYELFDIASMSDKALGALSGGMRQKVSAALAFLFRPEILILDEPTAALDPIANEALKGKIEKTRNEGRVVLITSHNLSDLEGLIDRVIYMMEGQIHFDLAVKELQDRTKEVSLDKMVVSLLESKNIRA